MLTYKYLVSSADSKKERNPNDIVPAMSKLGQHFIAHNEKIARYCVWYDYPTFRKWFAENPTSRNLHKVIIGKNMQKLKFDIDAKPADLANFQPAAAENLWDYGGADDADNQRRVQLFSSFMAGLVVCYQQVYGMVLDSQDLAITDSNPFRRKATRKRSDCVFWNKEGLAGNFLAEMRLNGLFEPGK